MSEQTPKSPFRPVTVENVAWETWGHGEERLRFKAGDYACFPAGEKTGHCLVNEGDGPCRYVVIGEHNDTEVCVDPDSNKHNVRWLDRTLHDNGALKIYWDGED